MTTHWHTGSNTPGYSPSDPEASALVFTTFEDAKRSMIDDLDRNGDLLCDSDDEEERALADEYDAAMQELNLDSGPAWDAYLPAMVSEHDLGVHFWIVECDEDCEGVSVNGYDPDNIPDAFGGVWLFAVMDDGGTLCEGCVRDETNPVEDRRNDPHTGGYSGWGVIGWDTTQNVEEFLACDHCGKVLVEAESCARHGAIDCIDPECDPHGVLHAELRAAEEGR